MTDAAPVANNIVVSVHAGQTLNLAAPGLLNSASDADGDPLTASLASGPSHGSATIGANGNLVYTPQSGFDGTDDLTYQVSDAALTGTATVQLNVHSTNAAPVAVNDSYQAEHDSLFTVSAATGLLANDTDAEGDPLTATLVTGAAHGTVTVNPDGSFSYTPVAGYVGPDSFGYRDSDGLATSSDGHRGITVADPHAPVAVADSYSVSHTSVLTVTAANGVLANDSDADGDPVTAVLVSGVSPAQGTLTFNSDGSFAFTPAAGFLGNATFQYQTSDGVLSSGSSHRHPCRDRRCAAGQRRRRQRVARHHAQPAGAGRAGQRQRSGRRSADGSQRSRSRSTASCPWPAMGP